MIPVYQPDLSGNELEYVTDCIKTGWVSSQGSYVERFEAEFAEFCGVKYGVAVANGTVSLHLALETLGIGPGDEVLVPTLTFVASASSVAHAGATPVFVECDPVNWTIAPSDLERRVTKRTRAIMPVHLYGHPADMQTIGNIASRHGLHVIEDAAEAHGAEVEGKRVGGLGTIGSFSFFGNKILTTGEGGMLVTNDEALADRARLLKDHAMTPGKRYHHSEVGYNYRMTNLQAALGLAQLERIEETLAKKRSLAKLYSDHLSGIESIVLPQEAGWARNVFWMYSLLVTKASKVDRDRLMMGLRKAGIDSRPFFLPLHTLPPYLETECAWPVAEDLSRRGMNLPSYPGLTESQIDYISSHIRRLVQGS
jgi:perosamine synthetase